MSIAQELRAKLDDVIAEQVKIEKYIKMLKGIHKGSIYLANYCNVGVAIDGVRGDMLVCEPSLLSYTGKYYTVSTGFIRIEFDLLATDSDEPFQPKYLTQYNRNPSAFIDAPAKNITLTPVPLEDLPTYIGMKHTMPAFKKLLNKLGKALSA